MFFLFFLFLLVFPLFCGACQLISNVYWKVCDWRCLDAFCWLFGFGVVFCVFFFFFFIYFFLLFYATWPCMLSVQCIISQTALNRATAVLSSAGQHGDIGPMNSCQWVVQRLQVRRTLIGQLWLKVLTWVLSASGFLAVCSLQSS